MKHKRGKNPNSRGNRRTHGMNGTRTYIAWCRMKSRCQNPNATTYFKYGAKGIKVCDRWQKFENFYEDMGECPPEYTIDRLDPRGDYELSNCRWATKFQQGSENKTDLREITYQGKTMNVSAWERELGFNLGTLMARLKRGWSTERTLSTPLQNRVRGYYYDKNRPEIPYRVHVKRKGKQHFVGRFRTKQEALEARREFIKSLG